MLTIRCFSPFNISQLKILCLALYAIFKIGLVDSLDSNFLSSLYILDISPLSNVGLVKIFPNLLVAILSY